MQRLARELNFSETVFVLPAEGDGHARIRIFTPRTELPFAGHPTLGSAFVLAAPLQLDEIRLETGKGVVPVRLERGDGRITFGRMTQPIPTVEPYAAADELLAALGASDLSCRSSSTTTASSTSTSRSVRRTKWPRCGRI